MMKLTSADGLRTTYKLENKSGYLMTAAPVAISRYRRRRGPTVVQLRIVPPREQDPEGFVDGSSIFRAKHLLSPDIGRHTPSLLEDYSVALIG